MEWLEAGLAFAVIMMVFSTMVSVIIETGHRFMRIREKGLQKLIGQVYEDVIWPRLSNHLDEKKASANDFVKRMTSTRFLPVLKGATGLKTYLYRAVNAEQLKSLSTLEFIERLAETPAGRGLVSEAERRGRKYLETFLQDLASKYEDFGEGATEYFKRRARLMSVLVAIGLAFSLNVNAIHLFKSFLVDKKAREAIIEQGNSVAAGLKEQEAALQELIEAGGKDKEKNIEEIAKNARELRETAKALSATGIPIGWDTAPWNGPAWGEKKDSDNTTLPDAGNAWLLLTWGGSVLLAGLFIGLGGPFWFDTYRKLSAMTGMLRGFQTPVQQAKEQEQMRRTESRDETKPETKIVAIFETAAKARALSDLRGRVLLTPEGKIEKGGIL
ncbi:MAG: hypothetical protein JSU72_01715 [Deltaproteobacteria bacterium]|nr:MAG: hypothetical protein JSU72_01715 [Deltaproteobacteria bacterium]